LLVSIFSPIVLEANIQLESGINDGIGTPYWLLPLAIITSKHPVKEFFVTGIIEDTILASLGGYALGTIVRLLWNAAKKREWVDKESRLVWTLALALFTTGLVCPHLSCFELGERETISDSSSL
jgi:NhaP-type Na+/H+ or K+/H+ antiporter